MADVDLSSEEEGSGGSKAGLLSLGRDSSREEESKEEESKEEESNLEPVAVVSASCQENPFLLSSDKHSNVVQR